MGSLNKVMVIGNLGRDAELRYTQGGAPVSSFSLAATEKWKGNDGQMKERTEWVRCVLWGKRAEALNEFLTKGKQLYVEGKMATREWEDKDGNKRSTTEVRVDDVVLLGGPRSEGGGGNRRRSAEAEPEYANDPATVPVDDDDIPF